LCFDHGIGRHSDTFYKSSCIRSRYATQMGEILEMGVILKLQEAPHIVLVCGAVFLFFTTHCHRRCECEIILVVALKKRMNTN